MSEPKQAMKIDVDEILRQRLGNKYRYVPGFIIRRLAKLICQDELNDVLRQNADKKGVDFCEGALKQLDVNYKTDGTLPADNRKVIIVSNHPLGGLDGMILSEMVSKQYGGLKDIKFVVNDLLTYIEPLKPIFYGVNKHGSQSKEAASRLEDAFESDAPVLMFPAGLCSRKDKDGRVSDLKWHKMAVIKAISSRRDIIPVFFDGENSQFFYKFARLRSRLGIGFNIEMLLLPKELFKKRGSCFNIKIGSPISWKELKGGREAADEAERLRRVVYSLRD